MLEFCIRRLFVVMSLTALTTPSCTPSVLVLEDQDADHNQFTAYLGPVPREVRAAMIGTSWKAGCPVSIDELALLELSYWGFDDKPHVGQLVVHREVAIDILYLFEKAYYSRFPIGRMHLVSDYEADDESSMKANNTSAFNCRPVTGDSGTFSTHSYGVAIDINPVQNPYVRGEIVLPPAGEDYLHRDRGQPGMIIQGDLIHSTFLSLGWSWGGSWNSLKDYQHFERRNSLRETR